MYLRAAEKLLGRHQALGAEAERERGGILQSPRGNDRRLQIICESKNASDSRPCRERIMMESLTEVE